MDDLRTNILPRDAIGEFIKSPRGIRSYEELQGDTTNIYEALSTASFLTVADEPGLGAERILATSSDLETTDAGAGNTFTLGLSDTAVIPGSYGDASNLVTISVDAKGRVIGAQDYELNSDNVTEGLANLFFTDARARGALSGGTGINYTAGTGIIALDTANARNVDHSGVTITAGAGLAGGGDITASRTLNVGAGTGITVNADDIALTVPTASGTYTPTLTGVTNVSSSTAYSCQYMRVGDVVTVSGKVDITPTAIGAVSLRMSLPVASAIANVNECAGVISPNTTTAGLNPGAIFGDVANDSALAGIVAASTGGIAWYFTFTYRVI